MNVLIVSATTCRATHCVELNCHHLIRNAQAQTDTIDSNSIHEINASLNSVLYLESLLYISLTDA